MDLDSTSLRTISGILGWDATDRLRHVVRPDTQKGVWLLDLDTPPFEGPCVTGGALAVDRVLHTLGAGAARLLPLAAGAQTWIVRSQGEIVSWDPVEGVWHGTGWPSPIAGRPSWARHAWSLGADTSVLTPRSVSDTLRAPASR